MNYFFFFPCGEMLVVRFVLPAPRLLWGCSAFPACSPVRLVVNWRFCGLLFPCHLQSLPCHAVPLSQTFFFFSSLQAPFLILFHCDFPALQVCVRATLRCDVSCFCLALPARTPTFPATFRSVFPFFFG